MWQLTNQSACHSSENLWGHLHVDLYSSLSLWSPPDFVLLSRSSRWFKNSNRDSVILSPFHSFSCSWSLCYPYVSFCLVNFITWCLNTSAWKLTPVSFRCVSVVGRAWLVTLHAWCAFQSPWWQCWQAGSRTAWLCHHPMHSKGMLGAHP